MAKFKDNFRPEDLDNIRQKLEALFESEGGFIIMGNTTTNMATDAYHDVCADCIMDAVVKNVQDADELGYLAHSKKPKEHTGPRYES